MLRQSYRPKVGSDARAEDSWGANIISADHPANVVSGTSMSVIVDFENDTPWHYNEFSNDSCYTTTPVITGVNLGVRIKIDGDVAGSEEDCVEKDAVNTFTINADIPEGGGTHPVDVEVYGAETGDLKETYSSTVNIIEEDPGFNIVTADPSYVEADPGETVQVTGQFEMDADETEYADIEMFVAGDRVYSEEIAISPEDYTYHTIEFDAPSSPGEHGYTMRMGEDEFHGSVEVLGETAHCSAGIDWFVDKACCPIHVNGLNIPVVGVEVPNLCVLAAVSAPVAAAVLTGVITLPTQTVAAALGVTPQILMSAASISASTLKRAAESSTVKSMAILALVVAVF